jgi:hypothetical protein
MSEEGPRSLHLSDGSYLNRGDWVCVPQRAMMQDSARYADANRFDSFRFASQNALLRQQQQSADVPGQKESKLTDASPDWPIWESEIPLGEWNEVSILREKAAEALSSYMHLLTLPRV